MHCDVDQENSSEHIRQCVEVIGVERIDHGVNILEDDDLVAEVARRRLGMTACPVSNRYVTGDLKAHEIKRMLDAGLKVTVNSDDPAYFQAYASDNLLAAQQAVGLTQNELVQLERNAFEVSWLPSAAKDQLIEELESYSGTARLTCDPPIRNGLTDTPAGADAATSPPGCDGAGAAAGFYRGRASSAMSAAFTTLSVSRSWAR